VAFLAMDLAWHERRDLSEDFLAAYARAADDYDLYGLVDFYESYRAYVRGKVSAILADDATAESSAREHAHATARKFYLLAEACTREPLERPTLYVTCGMIAAGKSSVARQLSALVHAPVTDADHVRKHLAGIAPTTPWHDAAFQGNYAPGRTQAVYDELRRRAEVVLGSGRSVILDASFRERAQRTAAVALAQRLGVACLFVECVADPDVCRARLRERAHGPSVSDGRLDIFDDFVRSFEPLSELASEQHVRLDTGGSSADTLAEIRRVVDSVGGVGP
ncbi:MAG: AAA family ATPase, partial [Polyangiales bacterium]